MIIKNISEAINSPGVTITSTYSNGEIFEEWWKIRGTPQNDSQAGGNSLQWEAFSAWSKEEAWEVNLIIS